MPWIDFKSGFALVGSLVVLVGSIVTRRNSMRSEGGPEGGGEPAVPEAPKSPEPASPATFSTVVEQPFEPLKTISFKKKRTQPAGSA